VAARVAVKRGSVAGRRLGRRSSGAQGWAVTPPSLSCPEPVSWHGSVSSGNRTSVRRAFGLRRGVALGMEDV
jgi:hypothetical protein